MFRATMTISVMVASVVVGGSGVSLSAQGLCRLLREGRIDGNKTCEYQCPSGKAVFTINALDRCALRRDVDEREAASQPRIVFESLGPQRAVRFEKANGRDQSEH
jgi:hypothetical protein